MTVSELIEKLREMPQDARVFVNDDVDAHGGGRMFAEVSEVSEGWSGSVWVLGASR